MDGDGTWQLRVMLYGGGKARRRRCCESGRAARSRDAVEGGAGENVGEHAGIGEVQIMKVARGGRRGRSLGMVEGDEKSVGQK